MEAFKKQAIEEEKQRLLRQHADILSQFNPKAASNYGASGYKWRTRNFVTSYLFLAEFHYKIDLFPCFHSFLLIPFIFEQKNDFAS